MKKVAKLVYVTMLTRVIVNENATHEEVVEASKLNFFEKVRDELGEHIEGIEDDKEMPYDEEFDGSLKDIIINNYPNNFGDVNN